MSLAPEPVEPSYEEAALRRAVEEDPSRAVTAKLYAENKELRRRLEKVKAERDRFRDLAEPTTRERQIAVAIVVGVLGLFTAVLSGCYVTEINATKRFETCWQGKVAIINSGVPDAMKAVTVSTPCVQSSVP